MSTVVLTNRANEIYLSGERIEARRYAAALILRELTRTAPGLVQEHLSELLDNLWTALRDPKVSIVSLSLQFES